jgi:putative nucleotidyltransferase with HDIG domain
MHQSGSQSLKVREMAYSTSELKHRVEKIQTLPTLSEVGLRIIKMASDPEISAAELSQVIQQDPSLAARLLKVANSPFYGMTRQVDSLQLALVILGLDEARNIALGLSLFEVIRNIDSHMSYDRRRFWVHCASCGAAARILARKVDFKADGVDFLAGLLHDLGKIIIDEYFRAEFSLIYGETITKRIPMLVAEREFLGNSHEKVGGWLVHKWRLPDTLKDAITHHHDFFTSPDSIEVKDPKLVSLCYLAEAFCAEYSLGWDGDSGCTNVREPAAWKNLIPGEKEVSKEAIERTLIETLQSFNESRNFILSL